MGDGRIRQQPLEIILRERSEVGARHGGNGNKYEQGYVYRAQRIKAPQQNAQQHGPCCGFYGHRHKSCHARGGAFISIRQPLMKWYGCDFKKQAGSSSQQCNHGDGLNMVLMRGHLLCQMRFDDLEIRTAG